jgi:hypothetical protein
MIFLQIPLSHLLSCFILDPSLCPPDSLLSVVNSVLQGTYKTSADLMNGSLQLLHSIQTTIVVSSPSHVLHILESLRAGLQVWIEDKEEVLTENEFNLVVCRLSICQMTCSLCIDHAIIFGHARCPGTASPQPRLSEISRILFGCWVFTYNCTSPCTACV